MKEIKEMTGGAAFKAAYAALNAAQKQAVDTIEGPVMVIAGPGTGKTQILTLRIANILLQTDVKPENILALTFTESGAKAMRQRLERYVGAVAYRVPIYTFHGFAQRLIRDYPDAYPRVIGGKPASDLEKIKMIESIIDSGACKVLRPMGNPTYYVPHILRMISQLKQEYITPDKFVALIERQETELQGIEKIHEKGAHKGKVRGEYTKKAKVIEKNRELLTVYRQYEALLQEQQRFDFDDMIVETVTALKEQEDMRLDLQETYQYVLADEHQDVNGAQNAILESLCSYHDSPNIFVVGDEKQAIYRFQGASLENFLYFEDVFKGTTTISLTENYRSGQAVLDAAHDLVAVEDGPLKDLRVPLTAAAVESATIEQREFSHQAVEDTWVIDAVQAELKAGVPAADVAVIVRTNREVERVTAELRKQGIPVTASADGDILSHPITKTIQDMIAAVVSPGNEAALFTLLHGAYWQITPADLVRTLQAKRYDRPLSAVVTDEVVLGEVGVQNTTAVLRVSEVLTKARAKQTAEPPHRVLEYMLTESGYLEYILQTDPIEGGRVVRRIYDEIEALVAEDNGRTLVEVSEQFSIRQSYGLPLNAPYISTNTESVQVMTAHKSKGLEFTTVIVPHLVDSVWGGSVKRTYFDIPLSKLAGEAAVDVIDDERRLLYVAMTRAKRKLLLSSAGTNTDGKELLPSRLLSEIADALLPEVSTAAEEEAFDPAVGLQPAPSAPALDPAILTHILAERGFSATSLNNYLRSPWDYVYRNVLRIPEVQPAHMQFGTAVHNVLESATRAHTTNGVLPDVTTIKKLLENELTKLPVSTEEYARLHEKGLDILTGYLEHLKGQLPKTTKEELSVRVSFETGIPELPIVPLTGKLDRIDLGDDGTALRVVDYKTGKPKSRNVIEGNTASSDGGYKRQLVFYALLLELHDDDRYKTRDGVLSFVEPAANGTIKEELFTITEAEISALKDEIRSAVQAIVAGDFLQQPCDPAESDYCVLANQLLQLGS